MSSNQPNVKKRFIAGARCSACHAQDKVTIFITPDDEWIECVDCGHIERRPTTVISKGSFDATPAATETEHVEVVQIRSMR
ncbi:MAG TPA: YheV family putative zinc ribbon protein [Aquirhabdus sp.]